jgi:hypothetical protein
VGLSPVEDFINRAVVKDLGVVVGYVVEGLLVDLACRFLGCLEGDLSCFVAVSPM